MEESKPESKISLSGIVSFFIVSVWCAHLIFGYRQLLILQKENFLTLQPSLILLNTILVAIMFMVSLFWVFSDSFKRFLKGNPVKYIILIAFFLGLIFISASLYMLPMIKIADSLGN